jgi:hypothetical protein
MAWVSWQRSQLGDSVKLAIAVYAALLRYTNVYLLKKSE